MAALRVSSRHRTATGLLACTLVFASCGGATDGNTPAVTPVERVVPVKPADLVEVPMPAPGTPANGEIVLPPEALLTPVLAHAAEASGKDVSELKVVGSQPVTWSDGSLGCPQPGMNYTQALVPGWHVQVRAGEKVLDYRLSGRGGFLLCRNPSPGGIVPDPNPRVER